MQTGLIGSGSWATAIAKIITENNNSVNWWMRNKTAIAHFEKRGHNPHYLSSIHFNTAIIHLNADIEEVFSNSDILVLAVPAAYIADVLQPLKNHNWEGKIVVSAIKGIVPGKNMLINEYLANEFGVHIDNYLAIMGPCHAEEVAAEKLSYLTLACNNTVQAQKLQVLFQNDFITCHQSTDVYGVQLAAILKNIYAVGAGIAHGLDYGDNFLSVFIANAADEMVVFLKKYATAYFMEENATPNYAASVYLGDLLVTCYSLHSRNRSFGNLIGKGYSISSARLEMNMVAEGYNAAKCIMEINTSVKAAIPIAAIIYNIMWEQLPPEEGFQQIEKLLL